VVAAGTMGGGITMNFLSAGIPVALLEMNQEALDRGLATIRRNYEASARKGRLSAQQVEERMALLEPTLSYDDLKDADMVIEAVFEDIAERRAQGKEGSARNRSRSAWPSSSRPSPTTI